MAAVFWEDNVVETATATTLAYQLGGIPSSGESPGALTFLAGIGNGNACYYRAEEVGGTEWEKGLGTVASGTPNTLARTRIDGSSNGGAAVNWTGKTIRIYCIPQAYSMRRMSLDHAYLLDNATIVASRSGNAETWALKTAAGADPSAADPVRVAFLNSTGDGFVVREVTAALSVTASSGSTLGAVNGVQFKVCIGFLDNAGTVEMFAIGRPSGISDNSTISTTAEGGAGAADSPRAAYSTTARSNVRCRIVCYKTYTLATAGTWNTAPSDSIMTRSGCMEIQVKELMYQKTLTAPGVFDTNEQWPGGTMPSAYDRFEIACELRATTSAVSEQIYIYFNGDTTAANYFMLQVYGGAGTAGSTLLSSSPQLCTAPAASATAGYFGSLIASIQNPGGSNHKHVLSNYLDDRNSTTMYSVQQFTKWVSTAAVNRIVIQALANSIASGSSASIYGLKTMTVLM